MHLAAAQLLVVGVFPGRHLHQRRTAQVHARAIADEDVVVAHPGLIGAARGGAAEDHRHRRNPLAGQAGDVVEEPPALREVRELAAHLRVRILRAAPEVAARGLDELDVGQPVQPRDLERAIDLLQRDGGDGAPEHRRIMAADDALDARDDPDTGDEPATHAEVGAPAGKRAQLEEGRVAVEQELDALPDEELAALAVTGHAPLAAARAGQRELGLDLDEEGQHVLSVPAKGLGAGVDARSNDVHVGARDDDSPACRRQSVSALTPAVLHCPTRARPAASRTAQACC